MKTVLASISIYFLVMLCLVCITAEAADPPPVQSDGSILSLDFTNPQSIKGWEVHGNGDFEVDNGELVFNQAAGDNALDVPVFKKPFGNNDEYVLQASFRITADAKVTVPFMILGLITDEGGVAWRTNFKVASDGKNEYTVGVQDPQGVVFNPTLNKDHMYILSIHITDGEAHYFLFEDENDRVGTFLDTVDLDSNSSTWIRIGNVFGAGAGAQVQDNVFVGSPRQPGPLAVSPQDKLAVTWAGVKTRL